MPLAAVAGRRVVVWGTGAEGRAAVGLVRRLGAESVEVVDEGAGPDAIDGVEVRRGHALEDALRGADLIVKSPGVSPYHGRLRAAIDDGIAVTGGTALWFAHHEGKRTIAVTGSKGKSTTSSVVAHLLTGLGVSVRLAGNIGTAPAELLLDDLADLGDHGAGFTGWTVLELSSYQASEVHHSPAIGVLTALFPEHLDWHGSLQRYYADKANLFAHRGAGDVVFADGSNAAVAEAIADLDSALFGAMPFATAEGLHLRESVSPGFVVTPEGRAVVDLSGSPLRGRHNAINLCGALSAVGATGIDLVARRVEIEAALATFRPLAHRLEVVGEVGGRTIVDDGLSTASEAAAAALRAFPNQPVTLVVGGHDRGVTHEALAAAVAERRERTVIVGVPETGARIVATIEDHLTRVVGVSGSASSGSASSGSASSGSGSGSGSASSSSADRGRGAVALEVASTFDEGVARALALTPSGGVLLLSPGAPSYGAFRNYKERSARFRELVGLS